jgi:hypothetical protein
MSEVIEARTSDMNRKQIIKAGSLIGPAFVGRSTFKIIEQN